MPMGEFKFNHEIEMEPDSVNQHRQTRENKRMAEDGEACQGNSSQPFSRPDQEGQGQVCHSHHDGEGDVGESCAACHSGQLQAADNLGGVAAALGHCQPGS